jgi:hypothetical protein
MKSTKTSAKKGAERLAAIVEAHLDRLSPADRAERIRAFHEVVARMLGTSGLAAVTRAR